MAAVTIHSGFGAQENKVCHCFHCFPIYLPWSDETRCQDLHFFNGEFQANFFTLLFHLSKRSKSSLVPLHFLPLEWYHWHIWGCWYFFCQSWLQLVIHPSIAYEFCIMYSAYKLNKKGDNIQHCYTPFPIWYPSVVPCLALTVASWPA